MLSASTAKATSEAGGFIGRDARQALALLRRAKLRQEVQRDQDSPVLLERLSPAGEVHQVKGAW